MATDASTLYKLIILYMLDRVNSPMTNAQISEFVLEKGYTTYFTLQEVLNTLISDGFITEESYHSSTHYTAPNGDYAVHCQVKENGHPIIDLTITVPDEQQADAMCGRWKDASPEIYEYIMTHLL